MKNSIAQLCALTAGMAVVLTPSAATAGAATFTSATLIDAGDTSYDGQAITIQGCTVTINGAHSFDSLQVAGGGVLTHSSATTNQIYSLQITLAGALVVSSNSAIDVSGRGYLPNYTLGNTNTGASTGKSGGSYGGLGCPDSGTANGVYGDFRNPNEPGSGGAGSCPGAGGGLLRITAASAQIDGAIRANGGTISCYDSGCGSGGAIRLDVGALSGSGAISANGGNGGVGWSGRSGGGGRVAIYYATATGFDLTNNVTALAGSGGVGHGSVGTVYLQSSADSGRLVLDSHGSATSQWTPLTTSAGASAIQAGQIVISGSGVVCAPTNGLPIEAGSLSVLSGAMLTHPLTTTEQEFALRVRVTNALTVDALSSINVSARGYRAGYTLGNSTTEASNGKSGGSYGGLGCPDSGTANAVYGDYRNPNEPGSGGVLRDGCGGTGGGLVRIIAGSALIDGAILANGESVWCYDSGCGSGGAIRLDVGTLNGAGTISADGGNGGAGYSGRSGGGGRVAIYYGLAANFNLATNVTAHGGVGGSGHGAPGTVYSKQTNALGHLVVTSHGNATGQWTPLGIGGDANFQAESLEISGASVVAAPTNGIPLLADSVTLLNGAMLTHPPTTTDQERSLDMLVTNLLSIDTNSSIDVSARGYRPGYTAGNTTNGAATGKSGGSYGGLGWPDSGAANLTYGDFRFPNESGSGGATSEGCGGAGGGLIRITAGGVLIDGTIQANGQRVYCYDSGCGSGGGIRMNVGALSGAGLISANGGNGNLGYSGRSGGGGRIAIYYDAISGFDVTNQITAHGGSQGAGSGALGTVYVAKNGGGSQLLLFSHGSPTAVWTPLGGQTNASLVADQLVISGSGVVALPLNGIPVQANALSIISYAALTQPYTTASQTYSLNVAVAGAL